MRTFLSWRAPMKKRVLIEGWMTRSRKGGLRLPLFRSHWIRRYFVLQATNDGAELDEYQCDRKDRLRKTYDLSKCEQVDSYLQMADSTCAYPRFSMVSQWIFSLHMQVEGSSKRKEIFFIAQSESEMNTWVLELCRVCGLERQNDSHENGYGNRHGNGREDLSPSLLSSPDPSIESLINPPLSDVTSEIAIGRDSEIMQQHQRLIGKYESTPRTRRQNGHAGTSSIEMRSMRHRNASADPLPRAPSSASGCSSMASSHRSATTEDDASSVHSTHSMGTFPPLPPKPKTRNHSSGTSSGLFGSRKVIDLGQCVPAPSCALVEVENESSGETIKLHSLSISHDMSPPHNYSLPPSLHGYLSLPSGSGSKTSSVCSSMAYGPIGPPVDRSKKPANLRLDHEDKFDEDSRSGNSSTLTRTPRTPQHSRSLPRYRHNEPPKSAGHVTRQHLDYFEPGAMSLERTVSVRSANQAEFGYIKIDPVKTQAIKMARFDKVEN